jgi:hypothetical protein
LTRQEAAFESVNRYQFPLGSSVRLIVGPVSLTLMVVSELPDGRNSLTIRPEDQPILSDNNVERADSESGLSAFSFPSRKN